VPRVPEERPIKLDVDPEDGPALAVQHPIVGFIPCLTRVLEDQLVCAHCLLVDPLEGPLGQLPEQELPDHLLRSPHRGRLGSGREVASEESLYGISRGGQRFKAFPRRAYRTRHLACVLAGLDAFDAMEEEKRLWSGAFGIETADQT